MRTIELQLFGHSTLFSLYLEVSVEFLLFLLLPYNQTKWNDDDKETERQAAKELRIFFSSVVTACDEQWVRTFFKFL